MELAERLKEAARKAEETAAEHKDQIRAAVDKAGVAADERTGGKYHEQIQKAGTKAGALIDGLREKDGKEAQDGNDVKDPAN